MAVDERNIPEPTASDAHSVLTSLTVTNKKGLQPTMTVDRRPFLL